MRMVLKTSNFKGDLPNRMKPIKKIKIKLAKKEYKSFSIIKQS